MMKQQWIRVEDRLPEPEIEAIVTAIYDDKRFVTSAYYGKLYIGDDKYKICWSDYCGALVNVTHWMPLPPPPEVEDAK